MPAKRNGGSRPREDVELLRAIWNEMKALRSSFETQIDATRRDLGGRIDQTNARLDQTNARLDQTNARLDGFERRQVEVEARLATELTGVAQAVTQVRDLLRDRFDLRDRVDDLDRRVRAIEGAAAAPG